MERQEIHDELDGVCSDFVQLIDRAPVAEVSPSPSRKAAHRRSWMSQRGRPTLSCCRSGAGATPVAAQQCGSAQFVLLAVTASRGAPRTPLPLTWSTSHKVVVRARTLRMTTVTSVHRPGAVAALRVPRSAARRARAGVAAVHHGLERRSSQARVSPTPAP